MRVVGIRNNEANSDLWAAIQKTIYKETQRAKATLPKGWRLIVEMFEGEPDDDPREFLHLDLQADEGGGSWAEAKIQTLKNFPLWTATHAMNIDEIRDALKKLGYQDHDKAKAISEAKFYEELTDEQIKWLINLPMLAPGFGGIRIPYSGNYNSGNDIYDRAGNLLIAFSGGAQWQDLYFALIAAWAAKNYYAHKKDEFLTLDFSQLEADWPEIAFWTTVLDLH